MPNGSIRHIEEDPTASAASTAVVVEEEKKTSGWVGVVVFAAILLLISGVVHAILGISAIVNDDWVVWNQATALFVDLNTWGWAYLGAGIVLFLTGLGLLSGNIVARIVAIVVAGISLVGNFFFITEAPVWASVLITIDLLIIWAIAAHGKEIKNL